MLKNFLSNLLLWSFVFLLTIVVGVVFWSGFALFLCIAKGDFQ